MLSFFQLIVDKHRSPHVLNNNLMNTSGKSKDVYGGGRSGRVEDMSILEEIVVHFYLIAIFIFYLLIF